MKYLLVLVVVMVALYIWRNNRRESVRDSREAADQARQNNRSLATPELMTRCAQCGTHLPDADAIEGRQGRYCSTAHRRQAEG